MAYNLRKINPLDLQPRTAIGVSLPFSGTAVFNSTYTTKDAIRTNLINFMLTGKRERIFNTDLGAGIRNILFDNLTQTKIQIVEEDIRRSLKTYFPTLIINTLNLNISPDSNSLDITLEYSVRDTNIEDEILINIQG